MTGLTQHDCIIVGGGITGTSCALALVQAGLRVTVIDQYAWDLDPPAAAKLRVSALTPQSLTFLDSLGLASWLAESTSAITNMEVWDSAGSGRINFSSKLLGEAKLGVMARNWELLAQLRQRLMQSQQAAWFTAKPAELITTATSASLRLANGEELQAPCIIGAEGTNSWVREQLHIKPWRSSYGQTAIVCEFKTAQDHQHTAFQCFTSDGPLALLPLTANRVSLVWSVWDAKAKQLSDLDDLEFAKTCSGCAEAVLGELTLDSERLSFPLLRSHTPVYSGQRSLLIGDALHSLHPLAGQGLNLGLADARVAAELLATAYQSGKDLGEVSVLRKFVRRRQGANLGMLAAMESMHRLFTSQLPGIALLRSFGMSSLDKIDPLKAMLMRHFAINSHDKSAKQITEGL